MPDFFASDRVAGQEIFDVTESFTSSLVQARRERGEPGLGVGRRLWEARRWLRGESGEGFRRGRLLLMTVLVAGVGAGAAAALAGLRQRQERRREQPIAA